MPTLYLPPHLFDKEWEDGRDELLEYFHRKGRLIITFDQCSWIDLLPLIDLLLQITQFCHEGGTVFIKIGRTRASRFLLDSGFVSCLSEVPSGVRFIFGQESYSASELLAEVDRFPFPPRILDFTTLVPCKVWDISKMNNREQVFDLSHNLYSEYIGSDKARAVRIPVALIYELKSMFQSVLPELLDNVRLHKGAQSPNFCAFYLRLRRRDESLYRNRRYAEPTMQLITELKKRTSALWQNDIAEAVFIDTGLSIQESWLMGWKRRNPSSRTTPRLPSGKRVDSHNADWIILEGVFTENASSFSPAERQVQHLPLNLTGLHSLRETIHGSLWSFSVRSGENSVVVLSGSNDLGSPPSVKSQGRYTRTPGVCYFFRFTSGTGHPPSGWLDALPPEGLFNASDWWKDDYPACFQRARVADNFILPEEAETGDVIICRANHFIGKNRLNDFLHSAERRGLRIIFAELASPVALRLYLLIQELAKETISFESLYPIITNSFHFLVAGSESGKVLRSFADQKRASDAWWCHPESPIRSARDVFMRCRQHDSEIFWSHALESPSAFLREPVRWSYEWILQGGYLHFHAALRERRIRKLLRKRIVAVLQGLKVRDVLATSDSLRHLVAEVKRNCVFNQDEYAPIALLASVTATGRTLRSVDWAEDVIPLPIFRYPQNLVDYAREVTITSSPALPTRVLDWCKNEAIIADIKQKVRQGTVYYSRIGSTEEIGAKPDGLLTFNSVRKPEESFKEWQALSLLSIGHYSYQSNHYFATLDLVGFINSQSPEASEMLLTIASRIQDINPAAIFYIPHEASEALIDRLIYVGDAYNMSIPAERIIPLVSVQNLRIHLEGVGQGPIVFLDDALVTGKTIREVRAQIPSELSRSFYSIVILDRGDPVMEVPGHNHFAWWSLAIPPVGPPTACSICRGLSKIKFIAQGVQSPTIRDLLFRWHDYWAHTDNLSRYSNRLEYSVLQEPLWKRLGSIERKNVLLKTSDAICTWALDMMGRLNHFFYPFDKSREDIRPAISEILAGMVFMYWDRMGPAHRNLVLQAITESLWLETRPSARSLLAVAIASLSQRELTEFSELLSSRVRKLGIVNFETGVLAYLASSLAYPKSNDATNRLASMANLVIDPRSEVPKERTESTYMVLSCMAALNNTSFDPRTAMDSLGLPRRSLRHPYLLSLLQRLGNFEALSETHHQDLLELSAFLDPVHSFFQAKISLFEARGISGDLKRAFDNFYDLVRGGFNNGIVEGEACRRICRNLYRFLATDVYGKPSVTDILSEFFIHYLPYKTRKVISRILEESGHGTHEKASPRDFVLHAPLKIEERTLLSPSYLSDERRLELAQSLQKYEVVLADAVELDTVLRDLALDVRHPKEEQLTMDDGAFIHITFAGRPEASSGRQTFLWVAFQNRATKLQAERAASGRTWNLVEVKVDRMAGFAKHDFDSERQILTRAIWLPALGRRHERGNS